MKKKYDLFKESANDTLYRIRALYDFGYIKAGDVGGFVDGEHNLSHSGNCWIHDDAQVIESACVYDDAMVFDTARVSGHAQIYDTAVVVEKARVYGNARVYGVSFVRDEVSVYDESRIYDNAVVCGCARVYGCAVMAEQNQVSSGDLTIDITNGQNKLDAIRCGVEDVTINDDGTEVICYKKVRYDLSSLRDHNFKYSVGEWVEVVDYDANPCEGCASGLHFAGPHYWDDGSVLLRCRVEVDDIIAVQHGKIRARRAFVEEIAT